MENLAIGTAGLVALTGYAVVFFGLILLMLVVVLLGRAMAKTAEKPAPKPLGQAANGSELPAPGSAGKLAMFDVPDRDAAMVMAIVADQLGVPLQELRFITIKEATRHEI